METEELSKRCIEATDDFNRHEKRDDGVNVSSSLAGGLSLLRELFFARIHDDVEKRLGSDSMFAPVSEKKTQKLTRLEIEIYEIVVSEATVRQRHYIKSTDDWYLDWLCRFRLGTLHGDPRVTGRIVFYRGKPPHEQQLAFTNVLTNVLSESERAPLVVFPLLPLAVEITTSLAMRDHAATQELRQRQVALLPAILHCHQCHGRVLENGESCRACGNPLWKYEWLTAVD